jgi:hypothetical protein
MRLAAFCVRLHQERRIDMVPMSGRAIRGLRSSAGVPFHRYAVRLRRACAGSSVHGVLGASLRAMWRRLMPMTGTGPLSGGHAGGDVAPPPPRRVGLHWALTGPGRPRPGYLDIVTQVARDARFRHATWLIKALGLGADTKRPEHHPSRLTPRAEGRKSRSDFSWQSNLRR